ncbi:hypothetical protein SAMN05421676_102363 [Salinibacillus kushneri]|uniref:Prophage pi2 protein 40 n=1 Tax=Salinibacillus kushneri TaxID=237682 RepID=A0A1I0B8M2_9BACI|nr:hypothetical protein [Salinibacillus kushneri]SET02413.1 hypothetical protein SAMN05421676_102363 [Salinibacillus kushneri]
MEKTLTIDGKKVRFKSTAATPLRYKQQYGREFYADIVKLFPLSKLDLKNIDKNDVERIQEAFSLIEFDMFYGILWALAKTADNNIPDPMTWLDGFDEFPLMDIFPEVQELIVKNLQSTKKK